jgi:3',5'-cyclic AMP phosphodiesterase CpdA
MRLAHCSDLHLLSLEGARILDFANKRWIGGMNLLTGRGRHHHPEAFEDMVIDFPGAEIDHVLCTGDLTNVALEQEFRFARTHFDRIALGADHVTVLPGNHDTYVAQGAKHFADVFGDHTTSDAGFGEPWPLVRVRGPIAIIGLSTSLTTPWFTAYGRVGDEQLARFEAALVDPRLADKIRIVAIHHPPAGKRAISRIRGLRDREGFAAVLARAGAELVLHGHEHEDLAETLAGPDGSPIPVLGIQSGTYLAKRPDKTARYRVFDIEPGPGGGRAGAKIVHHLRVWHRDRRVFARDDQTPE